MDISENSDVGAIKTHLQSEPIIMTSPCPFSASSSAGRVESCLAEVQLIVADSEGVARSKRSGLAAG